MSVRRTHKFANCSVCGVNLKKWGVGRTNGSQCPVPCAPRVASNAGYTGNGKFARHVAGAIVDELEQRRLENEGTDRLVAKKISVKENDDCLNVEYKVGRRTVREQHALLNLLDNSDEWDAMEPVTVLELATYYPQHYWSCYFYTENQVEKALQKHGVLRVEKRGR